MSFLTVDSVEDYRLTRWVARGLSLFFIGFNVILLLLNEDVRSSQTAGTIAMWILAIAMVVAWRWELAGGVSVMSFSLLFMLSMIYQWSTTDGLITPLWGLIAVIIAWPMTTIIVGFLFYRAGRYSKSEKGPSRSDAAAARTSSRNGLIIIALALIAMFCFVVPIFIPIQQELENPYQQTGPALDQTDMAGTSASDGLQAPTKASDGILDPSEEAVEIPVDQANDQRAVEDDDNTMVNEAVNEDMLGNDSGEQGNGLNDSAVDAGAIGTVLSNGSDVTYTPTSVTDGRGAEVKAQVTVTVNVTTDSPTAEDHEPTTGLYEVDNLIKAVLSNDLGARHPLLRLSTAGCTTIEALGAIPRCEKGQAEGTPVDYLPLGGPGEGHSVSGSGIVELLDFPVESLYGAYVISDDLPGSPEFPNGQYVLIFSASDASVEDGSVVVRADQNGFIVRLDFLGVIPLEQYFHDKVANLLDPAEQSSAIFGPEAAEILIYPSDWQVEPVGDG